MYQEWRETKKWMLQKQKKIGGVGAANVLPCRLKLNVYLYPQLPIHSPTIWGLDVSEDERETARGFPSILLLEFLKCEYKKAWIEKTETGKNA